MELLMLWSGLIPSAMWSAWYNLLNGLQIDDTGAAITKGKTPVLVCSPKLALLDGVDIWMGDHLDEIPSAVLLGKWGWCSGHQLCCPPLLQMLYVDWVSVILNLTARVSSGHSGFLPPQNWLLVYSNSIGGRTSLKTTFKWVELLG